MKTYLASDNPPDGWYWYFSAPQDGVAEPEIVKIVGANIWGNGSEWEWKFSERNGQFVGPLIPPDPNDPSGAAAILDFLRDELKKRDRRPDA